MWPWDTYRVDWDAVTGISTAAAVLIALLLGVLPGVLAWLARPRLDITIQNTPPDCHMTEMQGISQIHTTRVYYIRMRVLNRGGSPAENAEVVIEKVSTKQDNGRFSPRSQFLPLNLTWAHDKTSAYVPRVMPGLYKHCDLGWIPRPDRRDLVVPRGTPFSLKSDETFLFLDLIVQPNTGGHMLPPGTHLLEVAAAAANAKVVRKRIEITVTGKWPETEEEMNPVGVTTKLS